MVDETETIGMVLEVEPVRPQEPKLFCRADGTTRISGKPDGGASGGGGDG